MNMMFGNNLPKRQRGILELLALDTTIKIPELSKRFGVSSTTIRNDLNSLVGKGLITLSRGSVLPAFHPNITSKQKSMVNEKVRIAQAAAELVQDDDTIIIGGGTTAALVARFLLGKRDIHLISYSTLILPYVRINPRIHLTLVGGEFRPYTESLVGTYAAEQLERFYARVVFFGADGFSLDHGVMANLVEDAAIVEKIIEHGEIKVLLADSSKYGRRGSASFLTMNKIDILICDNGLSQDIYKQLNEEIKVILV
jgi:DeoR/GlpR family transcriptional regulator of sugar metabolism